MLPVEREKNVIVWTEYFRSVQMSVLHRSNLLHETDTEFTVEEFEYHWDTKSCTCERPCNTELSAWWILCKTKKPKLGRHTRTVQKGEDVTILQPTPL
jgi:hypothetical protein